MAKAIFVVPFRPGGPDLNTALIVGAPPTDGYGWSCIGHVPQTNTLLVLIQSTDEILDILDANPNYLFVEDVPDVN